MWPRISSWTAEALAVFVKDWRCEFRTRYALNTLALFAVITLVTISFGLGPTGSSSPEAPTILSVLLWVLLLFAVTGGLPRLFVHEEETHTATALRLAATPSALFFGKMVYGITLVYALEVLVTPLFVIMMDLEVKAPGTLVLVLLVGGFGLAAASTLIAAITSQTQGQTTLFAVAAFPILMPLFLMLTDATVKAVQGIPGGVDLNPLLLYDLVVAVAGLMLFSAVWNP